jgi:multiple sugar transport system substrate-binding protein
MKKVLATFLAASMTFSLAACGSTGAASDAATTTSDNAATGATAADAGNREKVDFWYLWGGDEASLIEQIISAYNQSQDKYEVVGLSTPDQQKIVTAISGGNGPDISDCFGSSMVKYANDGIAMPLDDLMSQNGVSESDYVQAAIDQQKFDGKTYALPVSMNIYALYYNKTLLAQEGIDLPKTAEELYSLGEQTTKVGADGQITQLGSPLVTDSYWYSCMSLAYGTDFGSSDGSNLTPDNAGFRAALEYEQSQVDKFGEAFNNFVTSGIANQYTGQDPFLAGQQVFRIDGPWLYKMAVDSGIDFDLMPIPGAASVGGQGYTILDTSNFFIPSNAKHADGAFAFMKYITDGDGAKMFVQLKGDLPAKQDLTTDQSISGISESFKVYLDIVAQNHLYAMPQSVKAEKYGDDISSALSSVLTGTSADDAIKALKDKVAAY